MTCTLIVLAHPGPGSFNAAWAGASRDGARAAGHEVLVSDLYEQGFDPVERAADPLRAHEAQWQDRALSPEIAEEVDKIRAADQIVFHFPIWWFGPPAMLRGWCERVLIHGGLHDVDRRFDDGVLRGKRALFCVTTGASAAEVGPGGKEGRLDLQLWPLAYTLRYCGMDVAEPVAAHGVHGYWEGTDKARLEARLRRLLADQAGVVSGLAERALWPFHADGEFTEDGVLRDGIAPLWPFHG